MKLETLVRAISNGGAVQGSGEMEIEAVAYDSRRVESGALFVAVPGFETDGHRFLPQALERGATAVLVQEDRRSLWEAMLFGRAVAVIVADDTRRALADVSAAFFDYPAQSLRVVGITAGRGDDAVAKGRDVDAFTGISGDDDVLHRR